jgi:tetratricopeptide (TPR) repeat protein
MSIKQQNTTKQQHFQYNNMFKRLSVKRLSVNMGSRRVSFRKSVGAAINALTGGKRNSRNNSDEPSIENEQQGDEGIEFKLDSVSSTLKLYDQGTTAIESGDYTTAIKYLSQAIDIEANFGSAYVQRGVAYLRLQNYQNAQADLSKALSMDDTNLEAYKNMALIEIALDNLEEAIRLYEKVLEFDRRDILVINAIAGVYLKQEKPEEALKQYERALQYEPNNVNIMHNQAVFYRRMNKSEQAMIICNNILEIDPSNSDAWCTKASINTRSGKLEEALDCYTSLLHMNVTTDPDVYCERANIYFKMCEYNKALEDLNEAITMNGQSAQYYNMRGMVLTELEHFQDALTDFSQVIDQLAKLNPTTNLEQHNKRMAESYYNRSICYARLEHIQEAFQDANRAHELEPSNEQYHEAMLDLKESVAPESPVDN